MRLAIISDIHGNAIALDAVLASLARERMDGTVCLGDAIQGGSQPAQVIARLRELACPVVMGNADAYVLTGDDTSPVPPPEERKRKLESVRAWSLAQLLESDRAFLSAFHPTVRMPLGEKRELLCFHGSPDSFDELIYPHTAQDEIERMLAGRGALITCGGHVHLQFHRRLGEGFHFNPGSVGMAHRQNQPGGAGRIDAWAEFAVLTVDGDALAIEFRRVPYDADAVIRAARDGGRPHAEDVAAAYGRS